MFEYEFTFYTVSSHQLPYFKILDHTHELHELKRIGQMQTRFSAFAALTKAK